MSTLTDQQQQLPLPQTQQQQQPVYMYPNTPVIMGQPQQLPTHSHSSGGSFGAVFAVLAVIIVISTVACCLGRLCSKKQYKEKSQKPSKNKQQKHQNQKQTNQKHTNQKLGSTKEVDIEFGFEKGFPSTKPSKNGGVKGQKKPGDIHINVNGHFKGDRNIHPLDREPKFGPM